ncbi:MAG TPA: Ig-like domain-containing protein [Gaiellaceae bacterium]|nr:Ig-like domain-containing protein [Gaiellaceae bacterium]
MSPRRLALAAGLAALALAPAAARADGSFGVSAGGLADGQVVGGTVHVEALPTGEPAQRVEFSVDGRIREVATAAPFDFDWDTAEETNGQHVLELWAVAQDGSVATQRLTLLVSNSFAVRLPAPADGHELSGVVHLAPVADGLPAQWLEVLVDGELRWTLDRAPYDVDWNTALESSGTHTLTVRGVAVGGMVSEVRVRVVVAGGQSADRGTLLAQTRRYRAQTWSFQSLMRVRRTRSGPLHGTRRELVVWRKRAAAARAHAARPPHFDDWMCIHSHEGAWAADTGNGYYGGLQMNLVFQLGYGPELLSAKGTADNWTPLEQMWVAERAFAVRGFTPWPQTARMCGLL